MDEHRGHEHEHDGDNGVRRDNRTAEAHPHDGGHDHPRNWRSAFPGIFRAHSHDASDSIDSALQGSQEGIRAVKISLLGLFATAALQLVIVAISGSVALLADTIHNFGDAVTAIPLWIAFAISGRAATRRYPYGYGRAEDLAGVFVLLMIALSAALAGYESIHRLFDPRQISNVGWVAAAGVIGFVGNEAVAQYRMNTGRRIGSAALVADGYHARTDGLTSLAVVAGAAGVWAGMPAADPVVGLLITVAILFVLKGAARQMWQRLMDGVEPEILERAERAAAGVPGVVQVTLVRPRWLGHTLHAEVHVTVDRDLTVSEAHGIAHDVERTMVEKVPKLTTVIVHAEPCGHDGLPVHQGSRQGEQEHASA